MNLSDLGFTKELTEFLQKADFSGFTTGRVIREDRERYLVATGDQEYEAEITGNLRFSAASRADFPAVGDWVTMVIYEQDLALIQRILPRKSILERQAVGKPGEKQIISTNVDYAFIMQSIDNNFNINRLERYLSICYSSNIEPVLIISKIDKATGKEVKDSIELLRKRDNRVNYFLLSNLTGEGLDQINAFIQKGKTYCVMGSSGVGKSTLINNLLKKEILKTREISRSTNKGRHATEHRELFVLDNGAILIDNPGMRELGMTDNIEGIRNTFQEIFNLTLRCKFPDCRHIDEKGCAVIEALQNGTIDKDSLDNFRKVLKEQKRFQISLAEKRRKDRQFGKMVKEILKEKKKNKF
ncbi:MAG: ribosome small subunit-dependent GTPase A [Bacteroidota bacterium]|nr:ribosome small subunit-dependent GTPase A [Bacteroidota bacterium]